MAAVTATLAVAAPISSRSRRRTTGPTTTTTTTSSFLPGRYASLKSPIVTFPSSQPGARRLRGFAVACLPSSPKSPSAVSTRLFVSGLSFRTTEESLRNAFQNFGELVEVNLVMDRIANRPRGFAFIRYATEEESKNAIEGMHGKFLDGRVIFVEVAKPRSELRKASKPPPKLY